MEPNQITPPGPPVKPSVGPVPILSSEQPSKGNGSKSEIFSNFFYLFFTIAEDGFVRRSLPTNIEAYSKVKTPKQTRATPRTPHHKDSKTAPRFYPVVKETRAPDPMVSYIIIIINF